MILSENGVDSLNPVSFGRTNECGELILELRSRSRWPLVFVQGPSGVGKRGLIELSLISRLNRLQRGSRLPLVVPIRVNSRDTPSTIAKSCIRVILENHPSLSGQSSYAKLGHRLANLAESDPVGVGRRLSSLLKGLEKGTSGLSAIKMVVLIDGLEKLFEDRKRCEKEAARLSGAGSQRDSLGFLKEMIGTRSVLFALSYRSWVNDIIQGIVANSRVDSSDTLFRSVPYPDKRTINSVVAAKVNERTLPSTPKPKIRKLAQAIRTDLEEAPQCLSLLSRLMDRLHDEAEALGKPVCLLDYSGTEGLAGFVCGLAEEVFQMKDVSRQAIWEELFREGMKSGDYALKASEIAKDTELWAMALELTDWRLFSLEGNSLEEATFLPIHDALYHKWERASSWMREEKPSLAIVRQFDEHAISWEISNRSPDGLLQDEALLENASQVLKDKEVRRLLSPLTSDFLAASLRRIRREKTNRKIIIGSGIAAVLAVIAGVAGNMWYNFSDQGVGVAMVTAPDHHVPGPGIPVAPVKPEDSAVIPDEPTPEISVEEAGKIEPSPDPDKSPDSVEVTPERGVLSPVLLSDAEIDEAVHGFQQHSVPGPLVSTLAMAPPKDEPLTKFYGPGDVIEEPVLVDTSEDVPELDELEIEDAVVAVPDRGLMDERNRQEVAESFAASIEAELPPVERQPSVDALPLNAEDPVDLSASADSEELSKMALKDALGELDSIAEGNTRGIAKRNAPSGASETETIIEVAMVDPRPLVPRVEREALSKNIEISPAEPEGEEMAAQEIALTPVEPKMPEGLDRDSTAEEMLASFKDKSESGNHEEAVDILMFFHHQIMSSGSQEKLKLAAAGKDLAISLGKIAMKQGDQKAIEKSWKLGFSGGGSSSDGNLSPELRLLMARVVRNAGRGDDASLLLSKKSAGKTLSEEELQIGEAVIKWHFGDAEEARRDLSRISPGSLNRSAIDRVFIPRGLAGEKIASEWKEEVGD